MGGLFVGISGRARGNRRGSILPTPPHRSSLQSCPLAMRRRDAVSRGWTEPGGFTESRGEGPPAAPLWELGGAAASRQRRTAWAQGARPRETPARCRCPRKSLFKSGVLLKLTIGMQCVSEAPLGLQSLHCDAATRSAVLVKRNVRAHCIVFACSLHFANIYLCTYIRTHI